MRQAQIIFTIAILLAIGCGDQRAWDELAREGVAAAERGAYDEADDLLNAALERMEQAYVPPHQRAEVLAWAGVVRRAGPHEEAAIAPLEEAVALLPQTHGPTSAQLQRAVRHLAQVHSNLGNLEQAERLFRQNVEIVTSTADLGDIERQGALNDMAHILSLRGKPEEARKFATAAIELLDRHHPTNSEARASLWLILAAIERQDSSLREAARLYRLAIAYYAQQPGHVASLADGYAGLAATLAASGKRGEAAESYEEAISLLQSIQPRHSTFLAELETEYAEFRSDQ